MTATRKIFGATKLGSNSDLEWLVPCAIMTAVLGAAAVMLMPAAGYTHVPPYFSRVTQWMLWCLVGGLLWLAIHVGNLSRRNVINPMAYLRAEVSTHKTRVATGVAGIILAGIDMLFYMWIKPEIAAVSPFWADEIYADTDEAIFGRDPWQFFQGLDLSFHAWAYSFFWMVAMVATLIWVITRPPSTARSASLLSYFALWSIFGPIGQYFGSAAGPIFYHKIGLGSRFAELAANLPSVTDALSTYLWQLHVQHEPAVGAGISAMPSLHIATVAWIYLVFRKQGSPISIAAGIFAVYIFILSVALGWHYAIDGIIGALGALVVQAICEAYLRRRSDASALPFSALISN